MYRVAPLIRAGILTSRGRHTAERPGESFQISLGAVRDVRARQGRTSRGDRARLHGQQGTIAQPGPTPALVCAYWLRTARALALTFACLHLVRQRLIIELARHGGVLLPLEIPQHCFGLTAQFAVLRPCFETFLVLSALDWFNLVVCRLASPRLVRLLGFCG